MRHPFLRRASAKHRRASKRLDSRLDIAWLALPASYLGHNPSERVVCVSYSAGLTTTHANGFSPRGSLIRSTRRSEDDPVTRHRSEIHTTQRGRRRAIASLLPPSPPASIIAWTRHRPKKPNCCSSSLPLYWEAVVDQVRSSYFGAIAVFSRAARTPCASFSASSLAQKWIKNMRG
jgi:hypothetical protein